MTRRTAALLAALALIPLAAFQMLRDRTPLLDRDSLGAAEAAWSTNGAKSYDLTLRITGDGGVDEQYRVAVRDGTARALVRIDGPATSSNEPGAYSVTGLFEVMRQDIDLKERAGGESLTLKAHLDPHRGTPLVYKRLQRGQSRIIAIERLESVSPSAPVP